MFSIEWKVGSGDVGPDGKLKMSTLVDMCQKCCSFQLDSCEATQEFYKRCNTTTFLLFRQMDVNRLPVYGEDLVIKTGIFRQKASYGLRNTLVCDREGNVLVASYVGGAAVERSTGKPLPYPKDLLEGVGLCDQYEGMEYLSRKVAVPCGVEAEPLPIFPVYRYMIDENNHVNNGRYMDVAAEYAPDDFVRVRIAYMKQARYGDVFHPARYAYDGKVLISLQDEEGVPYANIEYTVKA